MSSALSLRMASREAPHEVALIDGPQMWTFETLWQGVRAIVEGVHAPGHVRLLRGQLRRHPGDWLSLVATASSEALMGLLACFELELPVLLLHGSWDANTRSYAVRAMAAAQERGELGRDDQVVLATSGSTGVPKLVVHTRASLQAAADASSANLGWRANDRWLLSLPIAHVGGLSIASRCLMARKAVVLGRPGSSGAEVRALVQQHQVSLVSAVPTQLTRWLADPEFELPSVRALLVGGAPITQTLRKAARERGLRVLATYGMTEAASQVATERPDERTQELGEGHVGRPLSGMDVVVTSDGRIAVGGPALMRRMLGHEQAELDSGGRLMTRDLGRMDEDGRLYVLGRIDNVIISGGENVAAETVEAQLLSLGLFDQCCVVGVSDPIWGQKVVAVVVPKPDVCIDTQAWRESARSRLPSYALPKRWVIRAALPSLPSGKLDRLHVKQLALKDAKD